MRLSKVKISSRNATGRKCGIWNNKRNKVPKWCLGLPTWKNNHCSNFTYVRNLSSTYKICGTHFHCNYLHQENQKNAIKKNVKGSNASYLHTHNNIFVNGLSILVDLLLPKTIAMDDAHLLEEGWFARLTSSQQEQFNLAGKVSYCVKLWLTLMPDKWCKVS